MEETGISYRLPDGAGHKLLRAAFDYWRARVTPGRLPGRQHIDPVDMGAFLSHVVLLDVERRDGRVRFRVRVEGTALVEALGRDATGRYVDEVGGPGSAEAVERLSELARRGVPYYTRDMVVFPGKEHIALHRLMMPLAADGRTIDMILGCCAVEIAMPQAAPSS